jgi:predicted metal-dependent enzyme (double-stranded beta helix superfamily)
MNTQQLIQAVRQIKREKLSQTQSITRLSSVLRAFVRNPTNRQALNFGQVSQGLYTRLLLNSFDDDFQIVAVLWGLGSRSPIHDHEGTVGAVAALVGATKETKYHLLSQHGDQVELHEGETITLSATTVTPILPDEMTQLHAMTNATNVWAATVHVYLSPVMNFHIYEPQREDIYQMVDRRLWFDADNARRRWDAIDAGL